MTEMTTALATLSGTTETVTGGSTALFVAARLGVKPGRVGVPSMVGRTEATVRVGAKTVATLTAPFGSGKHPGTGTRTLTWH